jgi:hypothetical protein
MPAGRRKRGQSGAGAAADEEEASDTDLRRPQASGKANQRKKSKDAATAETAEDIARAEVESLVADDAAAKKKQPPPPPSPSKPAPDRSDKERTNQERIRVMEQNRKEKEDKDAQDKREAEFRSLEEKYRKLRQQVKTSKAKSSDSTTPKKRRSTSASREKKVNAIFDMWILPPTTSDFLKCTVQAEKIRADVADNMLERFKSQAVTRPLMRFAVHLLVSRLGPHFHYSTNKASVSAIIETVVVERNIGGITSREDYIELRDASREAENVFLSKLQGTLQKNLTGLRKNVRDLVAKFFENDVDDPMIGFVKEHVFGREPDTPLLPRHHNILARCFDYPCPSWKGTLLSFVNESSPPHPT